MLTPDFTVTQQDTRVLEDGGEEVSEGERVDNDAEWPSMM